LEINFSSSFYLFLGFFNRRNILGFVVKSLEQFNSIDYFNYIENFSVEYDQRQINKDIEFERTYS
jgi:hypothetical protein